MNDGILSQEEIDALLRGELAADISTGGISDFEKDAIGEIGNINMGTSATTLSTLLGKKVSITTPYVSVTTLAQIRSEYPMPYLLIEVMYTEGINGTNILIIREEDACVIADLMMGGEGHCRDKSLDEIRLSAVSEAMNQMIGSATISMSAMFNKRIEITPPDLRLIDLSVDDFNILSDYHKVVQIKFKMEIEDLVNSEIMQIIPIEAVKSMVETLKVKESRGLVDKAADSHCDISSPGTQPNPAQGIAMQTNTASAGSPPPTAETGFESVSAQKAQQFMVQPVQFSPLKGESEEGLPPNIGLIMDVPLEVTVVLGQARKTIKEILELTQGSIIQLDKLAGEPVDLLVNGKLVAKGEVVVIDESYGIRVTTILSPADRVNKLQ